MNSRFSIQPGRIDAVKIITRRPVTDPRGLLDRMYDRRELADLLGPREVIQINRSRTDRCGTVRGMHYQRPPYAEAKIVACLKGAVFDVAVDIRRGSATFLRWHSEVLSSDAPASILIPEGFAHGFQTLTDDCELLYLHTAQYQPSAEGGLHPRDPRVEIDWPIPITGLSRRDSAFPMLTDSFGGILV